MNKEEIDKMFHRIELDRANDSCGFEFADGFSCTFDNIATCYDDRLKLYELVKQLQQENEKLNHYKLLYQKVKDRNDKCINYIKYEAIIDNEYYRHEILDILKGNNE